MGLQPFTKGLHSLVPGPGTVMQAVLSVVHVVRSMQPSPPARGQSLAPPPLTSTHCFFWHSLCLMGLQHFTKCPHRWAPGPGTVMQAVLSVVHVVCSMQPSPPA